MRRTASMAELEDRKDIYFVKRDSISIEVSNYALSKQFEGFSELFARSHNLDCNYMSTEEWVTLQNLISFSDDLVQGLVQMNILTLDYKLLAMFEKYKIRTNVLVNIINTILAKVLIGYSDRSRNKLAETPEYYANLLSEIGKLAHFYAEHNRTIISDLLEIRIISIVHDIRHADNAKHIWILINSTKDISTRLIVLPRILFMLLSQM